MIPREERMNRNLLVDIMVGVWPVNGLGLSHYSHGLCSGLQPPKILTRV